LLCLIPQLFVSEMMTRVIKSARSVQGTTPTTKRPCYPSFHSA